MNLHGIAGPVVAAVNPTQLITVQFSAGSITSGDGTPVPQYAAPVSGLEGQVQNLSGRDLRKLDGINISGATRAMYINGSVDAVTRFSQHGGDLITLPDGTIWLTTQVIEQWPDWCRVTITLQNGS